MSNESKVHVAWLSGGYHRRNAMMSRIRERFPEFEYIVINSDHEFEYLMSKLRSGGCFNSGRLISVTSIPKTKNANAKKKYIERLKKILDGPMTDCFLVFNGVESTKEKAIFNAVKDHAKIYEYEDVVAQKDASYYISKRMRALKLRGNDEICNTLAEYCGKIPNVKGYSADKIEMALFSLSLALGEGAEVTRENIESITFQHDDFIIWDMMNALDAKDCERVTSLLSKLQVTDKGLNQSATEMIQTLLWRYRLIMLIREGYSTKKSRDQILSDALSIRKMTRTGDGIGLSASYEPTLVKTGPNAGQPASVWSQQVASIAMDGLYGSTPAVDNWSRREIYSFIEALTMGLSLLRGASENESLIIADTVLMLGCKLVTRKQAQSVLKGMSRMREDYA